MSFLWCLCVLLVLQLHSPVLGLSILAPVSHNMAACTPTIIGRHRHAPYCCGSFEGIPIDRLIARWFWHRTVCEMQSCMCDITQWDTFSGHEFYVFEGKKFGPKQMLWDGHIDLLHFLLPVFRCILGFWFWCDRCLWHDYIAAFRLDQYILNL